MHSLICRRNAEHNSYECSVSHCKMMKDVLDDMTKNGVHIDYFLTHCSEPNVAVNETFDSIKTDIISIENLSVNVDDIDECDLNETDMSKSGNNIEQNTDSTEWNVQTREYSKFRTFRIENKSNGISIFSII